MTFSSADTHALEKLSHVLVSKMGNSFGKYIILGILTVHERVILGFVLKWQVDIAEAMNIR